jgi:hypothetical protein
LTQVKQVEYSHMVRDTYMVTAVVQEIYKYFDTGQTQLKQVEYSHKVRDTYMVTKVVQEIYE